jgi:pimeloyl-ACP methyl ester carboxylesterase
MTRLQPPLFELCCALATALILSDWTNASVADEPKPAANGFVSAAEDVRLHYLDFGGQGDNLVFLAGGGNSAHVYDDFAGRFTDAFHVVALTRRGFGESSQPAKGYDTKTLADDIERVFDALHIERAAIVGHSLAGAEMTRFAVDHPRRVTRLVYLDAAYDWVPPADKEPPLAPPVPPPPTAAQLASPDGFAGYVGWLNGVATYPQADIRATEVFDASGKYKASKTPPAIAAAFAVGATKEHPPYGRLMVPVLAIYTVPDCVNDVFPWVTKDLPQWKAAEAAYPKAKASLADRRAAFAAQQPNATVVEMHHVPHFLFLVEPNAVAKHVRSFLTGGDARN